MGIIGRTDLIRHLRDTAPKSRATGAYRRRNDELPDMGYASYSEYLKSDDWKVIRDAVLGPFPYCCCCERPASQVHHWSYSAPVMLGLCKELLFPICEKCHEEVEFDGKRKRSMKEARKVLAERLVPLFKERLNRGQGREKWLLKNATVRHPTTKKSRKEKKKQRPPDSELCYGITAGTEYVFVPAGHKKGEVRTATVDMWLPKPSVTHGGKMFTFRGGWIGGQIKIESCRVIRRGGTQVSYIDE